VRGCWCEIAAPDAAGCGATPLHPGHKSSQSFISNKKGIGVGNMMAAHVSAQRQRLGVVGVASDDAAAVIGKDDASMCPALNFRQLSLQVVHKRGRLFCLVRVQPVGAGRSATQQRQPKAPPVSHLCSLALAAKVFSKPE
jgi:hypothetical protein